MTMLFRSTLVVLAVTAGTTQAQLCTLCFGGSPYNSTLSSNGIPCTELADIAAQLPYDQEACIGLQDLGYEDCGCPIPPPGEFCTLCPDGSSFIEDTVLPDPDFPGLTCEDVAEFGEFFDEEACADEIQRVAYYCGCPGVVRECSLCPGGAAPVDPTAQLPLDSITCEGYDYYSGLFTAEECPFLDSFFDGVDVGAFCCAGGTPPEVCSVCPEGPVAVDVLTDLGATCGDIATYASYLTNETECPNLAAIAPECCPESEVCTLCADGSFPDPAANCTFFEFAAQFVFNGTDDCNDLQSLGFLLCGCPTSPDVDTCTLCPDGGDFNATTFIDPFNITCGELAFFGALIDPDQCSDLQGSAYWCGCDVNQTCSLCSDGSPPLDPLLEAPFLGITCQDFDYLTSTLTVDQCPDKSSVFGFDAESFCCGDTPPGSCSFCPGGASVPDPSRLTAAGTCGQLEEFAAYLTNETSCLEVQEAADFCCGDGPFCTLCYNGTAPDLTASFEGISCLDYNFFATFLLEGSEDCTNIQSLGFAGCGCADPPVVETCSICPDGSVVDGNISIPYLNVTCEDLDFFASLLPETDDTCVDFFQDNAPWCCPDVPIDCNLCPMGASPTDPFLELPVANFTCADFEYIASTLSIDECANQSQALGIDGAAFCCPNVSPPGLCDLCPGGAPVDDPNRMVIDAPFTCGEVETFASLVTNETQCSFIQEDISTFCCEPLCPLCFGGSAPDPALAGSDICSNLAILAALVSESDEICTDVQILAFQNCGCADSPPIECDLCPDGSAYNGATVIPFDDLTCAALGSAAAFADAAECPDIQENAFWCGCSTPATCTLCPGGVPPTDPTLVFPVPGGDDLTCEQFDYLSTTLSESECPSQTDLLGIDGVSFCCADVDPLGLCDFCPPGSSSLLDASLTILGTNYTCGEFDSFATYVTKPETCAGLQAAGPFCCDLGPATPCNICGAGNVIGDLNGVVNIPDAGPFTCAELQGLANTGAIDSAACGQIPFLTSGPCQCMAAVTPTSPPTDPPPPTTGPPTTTPPAPTLHPNYCNICGEGNQIGNATGVISVPNTGTFTCEEFQEFGDQGFIPADNCAQVPGLTTGPCQCMAIPTDPPTGDCTLCPGGANVSDATRVVYGTDQTCGDFQAAAMTDNATCASLKYASSFCCLAEPCSLCSDGSDPITPDEVITVPGTSEMITCTEAVFAAADVSTAGNDCTLFQGVAGTQCGCPAAPSCNICGEGNVIGNPEGTVTFPGQGALPCATIQEAANNGAIPPDLCGSVPAFTQVPCQCYPEGGTPPGGSPTAPPTTGPPTGSAASKVGLCFIQIVLGVVTFLSMMFL